MTLSVSSSGNKYLLLFLALTVSYMAFSQRKPRTGIGTERSFLDTQWWLGLRFGLNYTNAVPQTRNAVFSPINYSADQIEKSYGTYDMIGGQAGLDMSFYHRGFSIGLQPTFKIMRYGYTSAFEWRSVGSGDRVGSTIDVEQRLDVIEIPLTFKYEIFKRGKVRPFVLAGLQNSFIVSTQKKAQVTHTEVLNDHSQTYLAGNFTVGNKEEFNTFYGALGGIGSSFDYLNIRMVLEVSYLYALSEITTNDNPYRENELVALGDVTDDLRVNNINVSLSLVFPLRYIDRTFQPY